MRYRTQRHQVETSNTPDGSTVTVPRDVQVPAMPRDWDVRAVRTAVGMVLTLTTIAVVWSTWSIGSLLNGGVGYGAASVFDMAWAITLILEWLSRYDREKRRFPRILGWALLLVTMGAIFWHGLIAGSVALAVVGAAVSMFAKVLWLGVMKHIDADLSAEDTAWIKARISAANAKLAVAGVNRQVARMENRAALELMALEADRADMAYALGQIPTQAATVDTSTDHLAVADATSTTPALASAAPQVSTLTETEVQTLRRLLAGAPESGPQHAGNTTEADEALEEDTEEDTEPLEPPTLSLLSKADAVRLALTRRPQYTPQQIAALLSGHGVQVTDNYVRQVRSRDEKASRAAIETLTDTDTESAGGDVVPMRKHQK
jgi:hypothetical protein